jgi:hypothetical protein
MTTEMTEANFSGKLRSYEAERQLSYGVNVNVVIIAAFLPKCT